MISVGQPSESEIRGILCHPDIWDSISDDESPPMASFEVPVGVLYIGGYVDGVLASLLCAIAGEGATRVHFQVLPEYRLVYARRLWFESEDCLPDGVLMANIPECYPKVVNFAIKCGFDKVDSVTAPYLKNGRAYAFVTLVKHHGIYH